MFDTARRLHLGLLFYVFKKRLDSMGSWLSQSSKGVLLQRRSMKLAQLHRTHMSGKEGLSQLQGRNGVLLQEQKMYSLWSITYTLYLHFHC